MIGVIRVLGEKAGNEPLEFVAEIAVAGGFLAENFENVLDGLFLHRVGVADINGFCGQTESTNQFSTSQLFEWWQRFGQADEHVRNQHRFGEQPADLTRSQWHLLSLDRLDYFDVLLAMPDVTQRTSVNNRRDILLLLLYSPGKTDEINEPITGRTRMVKMLFLFREEVLPHFRKGTEITEENFYEFFPWNFGPFSPRVYDDLEFFILHAFIESSLAPSEEALPESAAEWEKWASNLETEWEEESVTEYDEEEFKLSEKGLAFTSQLFLSLKDEQRSLLRQFKARTVDVPLRGLLRYVYSKYPEQTTKSEIREAVLGY